MRDRDGQTHKDRERWSERWKESEEREGRERDRQTERKKTIRDENVWERQTQRPREQREMDIERAREDKEWDESDKDKRWSYVYSLFCIDRVTSNLSNTYMYSKMGFLLSLPELLQSQTQVHTHIKTRPIMIPLIRIISP